MVLRNSASLSLLFTIIMLFESEGVSRTRCSQSDLQNSKLVPCSSSPINSTVCLSLGCCWNDTSDSNNTIPCFNISTAVSTRTTTLPVATTHARRPTRQPTSNSNRRDGFCVIYDGPVCKEWLNRTTTNESQPTRFIDNDFGINKTEFIISQFMDVINNSIDQDQEECKNLLRIMLCQYTLPPCDRYGVPVNFCREDCDAIFVKCQKPMTQAIAVVKYILDQTGLVFVHFGIPNCTEHRYSYEVNVNETCEHFGLFEFQKASNPKPEKFFWHLVGGIAGCILILVIISVAIFLTRRSRIREERAYKGVTFSAVTMRDRLRADTMMALDETKLLSLYDPDKLNQFPLDRIEYVKDLGEGNFGQVFQGRTFGLRPTDKPDKELMVAVKTLKSGCSKEMKIVFLQEVTLMSVLHHKNIIELLAVSIEEEPYGMIFEFMANGDLNQFLRSHGPNGLIENDAEEGKEIVSREDLLSIALQVAHGMEYLQGMRFVHRDLATRNCLVGDALTIKIADFGMSRDIYASDYYKVEGQAVMPIRWMPPEALLYGKFTVESDIYSYGVLLWEVYTYALQPYYGYTNEEVVNFIKKGVHLGIPDDCEAHIYEVMKSCWNRDALQRPNFETIKKMLKKEECYCDVPSETLEQSTINNPLYMNTLVTNQEETNQQSRESSPATKHKIQDKSHVPISTGYINIDYKDDQVDGPARWNVNGKPPQLEEGEQDV